MLRALRRPWLILLIGIPLSLGLIALGIRLSRRPLLRPAADELPTKPEAPPDLEKLRGDFIAGVEAVRQSDGAEAVRRLSSFGFGPRAVEEYRLYYLANGYQLTGDAAAARTTLTRLWRRDPRLVYAEDAAFSLAALHVSADAWRESADVQRDVAARTSTPAVAAAARWQELQARLAAGEVAGARDAARLIVIRSPRSTQAADAVAVLRAFDSIPETEALRLTAPERLERAVSLVRDGDAKGGLAELDALVPAAPESLRLPIQLNRGLALYQLRRFEDSNKVLEPLTSTYYKYAIPALYHLAKSYRTLAASIDPTVTKTVREKKRVGTVKVRVGKGNERRTVSRPKYATVKRTVKLVDLAKKQKKEEYERRSTERLKDLLQLPLVDAVRLEVLNSLIGMAEAKKQDDYEQELVAQAVKLDPTADPGLQHFWDKAWAAYTRGELKSAMPLFRFIHTTYTNPNVKRQAEYWVARSLDRQGQQEEARGIYNRLASAPYADLYALHSVSRGARRQENRTNPLEAKKEDWGVIAEREMPKELRLAYELTALAEVRDARLEIQKNIHWSNRRFGEALLADLYHSTDNPVLMYRSIRRAFPRLATVEQDSAPRYFIEMYYPVKYHDAIRKYAERNGVDPALVMGLILQESSYNPQAKSAVGATGLMQIMPPTGRELAQKLRIPFGVSRLENPEVNVELGTLHLRNLIKLFGGNVYFAVASYNAGQGNVGKWRRASPNKPLDEFLESIPFPETRNYVKRVTMLRAAYTRIAP